VTLGFEPSDPTSIPGMDSRTFSGLAVTSDLGGFVEARWATHLLRMDLVVIYNGTQEAKERRLLRRETRKGTSHRYTFWS
jgi:hypothetical protein